MTNNEMQRQMLEDMTELSKAVKRKVVILSALSRDGGYDLHDQITIMFDLQVKFEEVLESSEKVLPYI